MKKGYIRSKTANSICMVLAFMVTLSVLVIASVQDADMIIVMDNGRIASFGTHEELMKSSPTYRETYEQQTNGGKNE